MFLEQVRSLATAAACTASATTLHHEALRFRIDRRNGSMFGADQTEINAWIAWERWARLRPTPTRTADLPCFSKSQLPFRKPYHMFQASLTFSNDLHTSPSFSKFYAIDSRALHPVTVNLYVCVTDTWGKPTQTRISTRTNNFMKSTTCITTTRKIQVKTWIIQNHTIFQHQSGRIVR